MCSVLILQKLLIHGQFDLCRDLEWWPQEPNYQDESYDLFSRPFFPTLEYEFWNITKSIELDFLIFI